jgi:hypothetical protein
MIALAIRQRRTIANRPAILWYACALVFMTLVPAPSILYPFGRIARGALQGGQDE